MKNGLTIEGRWHADGEESPPHYGKLYCKPTKGLRLEIKEPRDSDVVSVMREDPKKAWINDIQVIQGWDADNDPVRLFGCIDNGRRSKSGMQTHKFFVYRAVTGLASGTWHGLKSRTFRFKLSALHSWMDRKYEKENQEKRPKDIKLHVRPDLTVILGGSLKSSSNRDGGFSISHGSWLALKFTDDQFVHQVRERECTAIVLFLSLLIGSPVALDDFFFLPKGETGGMVDEHRLLEPRGYYRDAKDEQEPHFMRASYPRIANTIEEMLKRWLALFDNPDMQAVLDLYAAITFSDLYDTAYFLFHAQALEAYHTACGKFSGYSMPPAEFKQLLKRLKKVVTKQDFGVLQNSVAGANRKTFAERLREVLTVAPAQIKSIITNPEEFCRLVKDIRNAYTHHVGQQSRRTRAEHDRKIIKLSEQAHCLLEMLLLQEMGAPGFAFDQILRRHATAVHYDLKDPGI